MGEVTFLRYSPDGKELVRISRFGPVEMIGGAGHDRVRSFDAGMRAVAFSPDGTRLATAEGTDGARVWDAAAPGRVSPEAKAQLAYASEVRLLDSPLRVLETRSSPGANSNETRRDLKRVVRAEFSPDGARLATLTAGGHVKVWNAGTWAVATEWDAVGAKGQGTALAFAADGKTLLVGDGDGAVHVWDVESGKDVGTMHANGAVLDVVLAPDGKWVATVHRTEMFTGSVAFWDEARKQAETLPERFSVAVSKDGKRLAVGGSRVEFLDPATRKVVKAVDLPAMTVAESNPTMAAEAGAEQDTKVPVRVMTLAFSPDGGTLAAGLFDGTVRLIPVEK